MEGTNKLPQAFLIRTIILFVSTYLPDGPLPSQHHCPQEIPIIKQGQAPILIIKVLHLGPNHLPKVAPPNAIMTLGLGY